MELVQTVFSVSQSVSPFVRPSKTDDWIFVILFREVLLHL